MRDRDCLDCVQRRAKREGLVAVRKISPGYSAGAWGSAREGDYVAVPRKVLESSPDLFEDVTNKRSTTSASKSTSRSTKKSTKKSTTSTASTDEEGAS